MPIWETGAKGLWTYSKIREHKLHFSVLDLVLVDEALMPRIVHFDASAMEFYGIRSFTFVLECRYV